MGWGWGETARHCTKGGLNRRFGIVGGRQTRMDYNAKVRLRAQAEFDLHLRAGCLHATQKQGDR